MNKRRTPRRKRKMTTMTFEVDQDLYQAVKEKLRPLSVTPEYAFQQMIRDMLSSKTILMKRYDQGENATSLIEDVSESSLHGVAEQTQGFRQICDDMTWTEKEVSFSQLRKQWRDSFQYLETPGQVIVLTQREKRRFLLSSLETELARTAYAVDDQTIANRCSLLEKMESQYL